MSRNQIKHGIIAKGTMLEAVFKSL